MIQQGQVFKSNAKGGDGSRRGRIGISSRCRRSRSRRSTNCGAEAVAPVGGRSVDTEIGICRADRKQNRLISSDFAEPSGGLEPSTPSL